MSSLLKEIADFNNLHWAWEKAKNAYRPGDIWFNDLEVAAFEANLSDELSAISSQLLDASYKLSPILPIPFPKAKDEKGPRTRQTFWVAVRDQVAWLAIVNIIGGPLDAKMPFWSYGNRLFLSMFYENDERGQFEPRFGYYRNTNKNIFRKWTQSWPLYRRHINLTARLLSKGDAEITGDLEEEEKQMLAHNQALSELHPIRNAYISQGYFQHAKKDGLFWCGIDLQKFYPSINNQVILDNFKRNFTSGYLSDQLLALMANMLDFRIDYQGWSNEELKDISLDGREESYCHLPTGLFVAGFLANLAMLEVDKQVSVKLEGNKNLTHFRYVDDHVILSNNFEQMISWIAEYQHLLSESNLGSVLNPDKTEPEALREYLTERKPTKEQRTKAEEETTLNPDFPTPLMTQTLAKVSRIAGTDFNLLTSQEEKNLIADVEHLLITDFPDHELRKDTRVSFAARMLSNMIPNVTIGADQVYQQHCKVLEYEGLVKAHSKLLGKPQEKAESVILEKALESYKHALKDSQEKLKEASSRLAIEEEKIAQRALKLLIKSVEENHDKIRLWGRLMEFFQKTGAPFPMRILSALRELIDKQHSNELSVSFLRSLILQVSAHLMLDSVRIVYGNKYTYKRKERALAFLKHVLNDEFLTLLGQQLPKEPKSFERAASNLFSLTAGTVLHLLQVKPLHKVTPNMLLVQRYGLVDWNDQEFKLEHYVSDKSGAWAWWLLNRLPVDSNGLPLLWRTLAEKLEPVDSTSLNVLLLQPRHIPHQSLKLMDDIRPKSLTNNQGLLFDIYQGERAKGPPYQYQILNSVAGKLDPLKEHITLYDWIEWTSARATESSVKRQNSDFDPRQGEWMALEITRQLAVALNEKLQEFPIEADAKPKEYFKFLHPHNFKLPKQWTVHYEILSWENLRKLLQKGKIEFGAQRNWISEKRFLPTFSLNPDNQQQAILTALGSMLVSLLAKNTDLPAKWNPLGLQQGWAQHAKSKLRDLAISSRTRDIISGCFSARNVETQLKKRQQDQFDFLFDPDTKYDPPQLTDVDDFIAYLELALEQLEKQQLSVSDYQPRQLTPISLIRLQQETYRELLDKAEIE